MNRFDWKENVSHTLTPVPDGRFCRRWNLVLLVDASQAPALVMTFFLNLLQQICKPKSTPPMTWTTLTASPLSPADDGSFSFIDTNAPPGTAYYRLVQH